MALRFLTRRLLPVAGLGLLLVVACGKQAEVEEQDPSTSLQGRWTGQLNTVEDGVKTVEILSIFFYKSMAYKWTYTVSVHGVQDEDGSFEEEGTFAATETEIVFTTTDGAARTYTYELTGRSDILLILSNGAGFLWNFTDYWKTRYESY